MPEKHKTRSIKRIAKVFAIILLVGAAAGGVFVGYMFYQEYPIPIIAIECEMENDQNSSPHAINGKRHYLIKKKRNSSTPEGLYRPAYYNDLITQDTSFEDYWRQYPYRGPSEWRGRPGYTFTAPVGYRGHNEWSHWIARDNLEVIFWFKDEKSDKWDFERPSKCRQITFEEFASESKRGLQQAKSELRF